MCHISYHLIDISNNIFVKKIFFRIKRKSEFALVNFNENIYIVFTYFFHKFKVWMTLSTSFGSYKVHSFLKLCFAWYSIETILWYLQLEIHLKVTPNCVNWNHCFKKECTLVIALVIIDVLLFFCKWVYKDSSNRSLAALCNPLTGCRLGGVNITILNSILQIYSANSQLVEMWNMRPILLTHF